MPSATSAEPRARRRAAHPRPVGALVALATTGLLVGMLAACGDPAATAPHRPDPAPTTTSSTSTAPTATPTTALSATPTTTPLAVAAAPGWSDPVTVLPPGAGFTSVSCLSDTLCVAVGGGTDGHPSATDGSGVAESWDGAAWSGPGVFAPAPATGAVTTPVLPAVDCTGGPTCVIVDGSGHTVTGDGTNWSEPAPLPLSAPLPAAPGDPGPGHADTRTAAVSCPSPAFCSFVDNTGQVAVRRGGAWTEGASLGAGTGGRTALYQPGQVGLSCPDVASCTAVVGTAVLAFDGTGWSTAGTWAGGGPGPTAVSCASDDWCAVVHGSSVSVGSARAGWSPATVVDTRHPLDAVSCPSTAFCLAADEGGSVVAWNGTSWSAPLQVVPVPSEYPADGTSLSCPSAQFCMVLDGDGDEATFTAGPPG